MLVRPLHQGVAEVVGDARGNTLHWLTMGRGGGKGGKGRRLRVQDGGHEQPKCASGEKDEEPGVRTKTAAAAKGFEQQLRGIRGLASGFQ